MNSLEFEQHRDAALQAFVEQACDTSPKKRNKEQRRAVALHKQQQNEEPMFDSGPLPTGSTIVSAPTKILPTPPTSLRGRARVRIYTSSRL